MPQNGPNVVNVVKYQNIAAAATTTVKSGKGVLKGIVVNGVTASTVLTMYDSLTATGTKIGTATIATTFSAPGRFLYELNFNNGLTIVSTGTFDITVLYA